MRLPPGRDGNKAFQPGAHGHAGVVRGVGRGHWGKAVGYFGTGVAIMGDWGKDTLT